MLSYTLPVLLFGDFRSNILYIFFILTSVLIFHRLKKTYKSEKISNLITYIICSFSLGIFHLYGFNHEITKNILRLSLTYGNVYGFWIGYTGFLILHDKHKAYAKKKLFDEFNHDETRINREKNINSILGKWY